MSEQTLDALREFVQLMQMEDFNKFNAIENELFLLGQDVLDSYEINSV